MTTSTATVKHNLSVGLLLAAITVLVACVTGCGVSHSVAAPRSVVFMGDSVTYNWSLYSTAFKQNTTWNDQGIIGNTSLVMLARFNPDAIWLKPGQINILAGTNDVYPYWVPCDVDNMPQFSTCANIAQMVTMSKAAGIVPILGTIPPWGCVDSDNHCALATNADNSPGRYDRIDQLNAFIKAYGFSQGLVVVDYHSVLVAADGKHYQPALTIDGVHPSAAGYLLMTPMVEDAIQASKL